jgi:UDP-glucose 6-dehydrogenase
VTCVDKVASKIAALRCGDITIHEPGLADLMRRNVEEGRLSFTAPVPTGTVALVIATEWDTFRALDLPRLSDLMRCPVVVDLRNI